MEQILSENLKAMLAVNRHGMGTQAKIAAAAKHAGFPIDQKTVSRAVNATLAVKINTLQSLAAAFDVEPYQLLIPGLDPRNPQVLRMLSADEERFYKMLEEMRGGAPG